MAMAFSKVSDFPLAFFERSAAEAHARGPLEGNDGVRAEALEDVGDRAVETGQNGADANDGAGADDHAEDGEESAQLVGARLL